VNKIVPGKRHYSPVGPGYPYRAKEWNDDQYPS
ncbi:uncharacterized protein METZ01_LOCUS166874, partial [marine metagenome]